tara:strand:- start:14063 stop:14536 length:474 start_codon:yes stop_codon:yes gene_type:complete
MLSIKLVYICVLLFIIFITLCFTINIVISKNEDILPNTNIISMIAIIIMIIFVIYNVIIHKPENKILKDYDNKIHNNKQHYLDNNLIKKNCTKKRSRCKNNIIKKKCNNTITEDNYQNLLYGEYIDETENEYFYKTIDDYHNIEKYVNETYLSKYKL